MRLLPPNRPARKGWHFPLIRTIAGVALLLPLFATNPAAADAQAIVHAPETTAWYGQPIPIEAISVCQSGSDCGVRLFYRSTKPVEDLLGRGAGAWSAVELTDAGATSVGGDEARSWTGQIPGTYVTTTGVDYFLEAYEDANLNRLPPSAALEPDEPIGGYFHVSTVSPPLIQHTPPLYAYSDRSVLIEATATCSTPECLATLWYRQSDGGDLGELTEAPAWPSQAMRLVGTAPVAPAGSALVFQADIPASAVTTAGVDYFIELTDGHTTSWWPGTTYQGYYAPRDGMRTGYHHVHVLEASEHRQPAGNHGTVPPGGPGERAGQLPLHAQLHLHPAL